MKVALLCNMNNTFFSLARYLRDEGWDCDLLLLDVEFSHFYPEMDVFDRADVHAFIRQLSWGDPAGIIKLRKEKIRKDLAPYDFLMGCGGAPAFVAKAGRTLDAFVPCGHDLYQLPFYSIVHPVRIPAYWNHAYLQRQAINGATSMVFNETNDEFEKAVRRLAYPGKRFYCTPPMLYHPEYEPQRIAENLPKLPQLAQLEHIRAQADFVVFQHGRQHWKSTRDLWANKGNDILLHGFAAFIRNNPDRRAHLILYEYGDDVAATKNLIAQLKLEGHITWLPLSPRKWIMLAMQFADVVVGELYRSWLTYGVVCEALSMGKPLLHRRDDALYQGQYDRLYPMLHAQSAAEVAAQLEYAATHPAEVKELGQQGREWLLKYAVKQPVDTFSGLIKAAK